MTRARAPGKVVISGAYAVLAGAPAIVSAVDRYVVADTSRLAEQVTPEVRAALGDRRAPWFDASALRGPRGKLGLGSSAAILVASLAALELAEDDTLTDQELCRRVLGRALGAHRAAQGGGSGIDVATSGHGGTLVVQRTGEALATEVAQLPPALCFEVWAGGEPASTPQLLARVGELATRDAPRHAELLGELGAAAREAVVALGAASAEPFVRALDRQCRGLGALGAAAGAPIVTEAVARLAERARQERATVLPSGAGGGDVALYVGPRRPSPELDALRAELGHERLELALGARGVHAYPG